jgi:anti-sigma factor RsiW
MTTGEHASDGDLVAWDDGSVDEARRTWLSAHLAGCSACRERLAGLQEVDRWIQEQYPLVDDSAARGAIIERLRAEREKGASETQKEREEP